MRVRVLLTGIVIAIGGFALAALAAASPGSQQYTTTTVTTGHGGVAGTQGEQGVAAASHSGGTLPFTGMSLVWIVAAGTLLIVLGLALRRRGRSDSN
jgi:hypothetical protein